VGHDLVWAARAKQGGLGFAKEATVWVLEALADAGVPEPWVKYSGSLGFDLVIPLEMIPCEAWVGGVDSLANLQEELTSYVGGYLREQFPDVNVVGVSSPIEIKQREKTCIFSEFRARRGLLLAPMSLRPETGLVSVPVDPRQVGGFSVLDASPKNVRAFGWERPSKIAQGLVRYVKPWQSARAQTSPAVA
jgi:DNA primase